MESRITRLEMLLMEQESTIEALNREVQRQQLQVRQLEDQIDQLKEQLESIQQDELLRPEEEETPPPHY